MGESAPLSFAPKISGEFLSIWAKFPQISKFFGWTMDEIRPNRKKLARNFWGRTSTARIRPVRPKKYLLCMYPQNRKIDRPPYENRGRVLVIVTLKKKRDAARVLLILDLMSGKINSSFLLSQIGLSVPSNQTRNRVMLHVKFHETIYGVCEPINAVIKSFFNEELSTLFRGTIIDGTTDVS
jgi:hypothetical protein